MKTTVKQYNIALAWTERVIWGGIFMIAITDYYGSWRAIHESGQIFAHAALIITDSIFESGVSRPGDDLVVVSSTNLSTFRFVWCIAMVMDLLGVIMQTSRLVRDTSDAHIEQLAMMVVLFIFTIVRAIVQPVFGCNDYGTVTDMHDSAAYT